jgi:hypothetical protein
MDAKTPTGGRDRIEGFAPEKRRTFHRGTLAKPHLGGLCPLHWNVGLGKPITSPGCPRRHPALWMFLAGSHGSYGTCGSLEKPKEG